jgi:6-phosphogluconolactonase
MPAQTPDMTSEILPDSDALAHRAAEWLVTVMGREGRLAIALSGGATPQRLYELLARPPYRDVFPWSRTHWFWGDERFVAPDDPLSNFRMVREALLSHVPIAADHVHPVPTVGMTPEAAADAYERALKAFYGAPDLVPGKPLFDVTLLGLGPDGHTASLFPGTSVLEERTRWVAPVLGAKAEARITLTYSALESTRHAAFLVSGAGKRAALAGLREGDARLPAARFHPAGTLHVFADAAAAG